jgi:polar amino acid transport system substrate-binding protein
LIRSLSFSALIVTALVSVACGSPAATGSPPAHTNAPSLAAATPAHSGAGSSTVPTTEASAPASGQASAPASPPASVGVVASVAPDQLEFSDKLVICSDIPYPPQEFFDADGNPIGSDIEIAQGIAARLGLTPVIQNSVFDTIIPALLGGKCDLIASAQNITSDRITQVDMIPFFQAGQSFVVAVGNPAGITSQDSLCGKKVAAETGTTEVDYLNGTNDYKGQGLSKACTDAGNAAITVTTFAKDSDALLALQTGKVDAYFADSPVAGYYAVQHPDQFALSGVELGVALEGLSVSPDHKGLSAAAQQALVSMINDGTYMAILQKYGDADGAVTADVAGTMNKTK